MGYCIRRVVGLVHRNDLLERIRGAVAQNHRFCGFGLGTF